MKSPNVESWLVLSLLLFVQYQITWKCIRMYFSKLYLFVCTTLFLLMLHHPPPPLCHISSSLIPSHPIPPLSHSCSPTAALRGDRHADRRAGGHGGALHPAPGRGAEGGATGRPHRGRLRPGEQDGEGLPGHPQGHRLHRLPLHPLRDEG